MKNKNAKKSIHLLAGTDIGGSEMLALNIARSGRTDFIFVAGKHGALASEFENSPNPFRIIRRKFPLDPLYIFQLWRISRQYSVEILHAHQLLEGVNAWFLSLFTGQKVFITYHGFSFFSKNSFVKQIGLFLSKRVRQNIFVSGQLKEYYEKNYNLPSAGNSILYNGIPVPDLKDPDTDSLRKEFNISTKAIVLGMTGNFSQARNHILVCEAFYSLLQNHKGETTPHLIFIGKKDTGQNSQFQRVYDYCEKRNISDKVHFAGSRPHARNLLHNFDVFVYASHRETFCLSMVEAIMAGIPVIVNDFPVLREVSLDGKLAELFPTGDHMALSEKMKDTLKNLAAYKLKAQENMHLAIKNYSIEKHIEGLLSIYHKFS